jgi:surface protein
MEKLIYIFLGLLIVACSGSDDSGGNDSTAPIITLNGQAIATVNLNSTYTDAGATAVDDVDGDLTSSIVTSGTVNVNSIGTYTITYSVSNSAGNIGAASRRVNIIEDYENPVYLDDNGITIKAKEWSEVGAVGEINGITYTIVDKLMLLGFIENESDVTKLVTTKITNMNLLFYEATNFNQAIESWDVSNVTDMYCMFWAASLFNKDIGIWDVSNVTKMNNMFTQANAFNQDIGNWNVSNVTSMRGLFVNASNFNQALENWDVRNVTNCDSFGSGAPLTQENTPNFTNCTP